jgi:hypothetical protein
MPIRTTEVAMTEEAKATGITMVDAMTVIMTAAAGTMTVTAAGNIATTTDNIMPQRIMTIRAGITIMPTMIGIIRIMVATIRTMAALVTVQADSWASISEAGMVAGTAGIIKLDCFAKSCPG